MPLSDIKRESIHKYVMAMHKIQTAYNTGKSKDYINHVLEQGCPNGYKRCMVCTRGNGKSKKKGKGKNSFGKCTKKFNNIIDY